MIGLPGLELDPSTMGLVSENHITNFILFKRNIKSPDQVRSLCESLASFCAGQGLGHPLIAIDQEGGTVKRLPPPFTQFAGARELACSSDPNKEILSFARTTARELKGVGINMDLTPVLDICPANQEFFMESRSYGDNPAIVAEWGGLVIKEMQKEGIVTCAKHFPGLGAAVLDPHLQLPTVAKDLEELSAFDLLPFKEAIACGVGAIMTSHTIYSGVDPEFPATLSKKIITGILRTSLSYNGLIITDDLEMGAIENEISVEQAAVNAFLAGVDMLLICHDHDKIERAYGEMTQALSDGRIPSERIDASFKRVEALCSRFAG